MSFIFKCLDLIISIWDWVHDRGQQQIGAQKQVISDDKKAIEVQQAELQASTSRPTDAALSDELQHGKF